MSRTLVKPQRSGLASIALYSGALCLMWLWLAAMALMAGQVSTWVIAPVSVIGAAVFGWIAWWAIKRRGIDEPAVIIDEVGIFDNVSIVQAGRVKWRDTERVWISGPNWMPFLCVMPEDLPTYFRGHEEIRGAVMRFNKNVLGAPIVIPIAVLDMSEEEIWRRISQVAGGAQTVASTPGLIAGS